MWSVYLLSLVAGFARNLPAISLIAAMSFTVLVIDATDLWVTGETPVTPTASMLWMAAGETALAVLPAAAIGFLICRAFRMLPVPLSWRESRWLRWIYP